MGPWLVSIVFFLSNSLFFLFEWTKIAGKFNISDLGIALVVITSVLLVLKCRRRTVLKNIFTYLLFFQLLFCVFHIFYVILIYNYDIFNAIVASRSYLYYLSFFVMVLVFETPTKVIRTLNILSNAMIIICLLSVYNYYIDVIFNHEWAAGHYERAGVKRAFIPGMSILSMTAIWSFVNMVHSQSKLHSFKSIFFIIAHVFRQSRLRLFGVVASLAVILVANRRIKLLIAIAFIIIIGASSVYMISGVDIVGKNVELTVSEMSESRGSFGGRLSFLEAIFSELEKSPLVGTGGSAIRAFQDAYVGSSVSRSDRQRYWILGKQSDVGFFNWIKNFGAIGFVWLLVFAFSICRYLKGAENQTPEDQLLRSFCAFFSLFLLITSPFHEHLINSNLIPTVMLLCAILVRLNHGWDEV